MDPARARKLGERIMQIVAEMLERRIKDPRLGFVTVTDARVTGDLREATVFYTVYGSAQEQAASAAALTSATGVIRSEVGRQTGLKHTPSITFKQDTLPEGAKTIEELVARAREADAALAEVRSGAVHAGDPDPYRTEVVDDDETDADDEADADDTDADETDADETGHGSAVSPQAVSPVSPVSPDAVGPSSPELARNGRAGHPLP
jgi:ribosome-binding factor A